MFQTIKGLFSRLFNRKGDDEYMTVALAEHDGPLFAPGDSVVILNPFMVHDDFVFDDMPAPKHATIKRVAYITTYDIYAYELNEYSGWYNESWLQPDVYMPMNISVQIPSERDSKKERADQIDNLLDIANWNRKKFAETGKKEYAAKIAEVEAELKSIVEK